VSNSSAGLMFIGFGVVTALLTPWRARGNVWFSRTFMGSNAGERSERLWRWWGYFVAASFIVGGMGLIIFG
jgi:hypothetical protein